MSQTTRRIPTNAEYIRELLKDAPPLTDEQVAFIRYQLAPGGHGGAAEFVPPVDREAEARKRAVETARQELDSAQSKFEEALTSCRGCDVPKGKHHFVSQSSSLATHEYEPLRPTEIAAIATDYASIIQDAEQKLHEAMEANRA